MAACDVVVVGARCAGAALAQRLAGAGLSVALLDAARLPSDQGTSTHLIQPPGMDELDALGVGDAVRSLSPALHTARLTYDGRQARLPYPPGRPAHCLRREPLDHLLQQAAVAAGAALMPLTRVVDVVRDRDGRVRGVEVRRGGGGKERLAADLVVGADGRHSTIAKLVGAEEYLGYDGPRAVYWSYWRRPSAWDPHELHNWFAGDDARVVFPTDDGLVLVATAPPIGRARTWRADHTKAYVADVRQNGPIGGFLGDDEPVSEVRGVLKSRYFFRTSAGAGWALLGDAGHHKEFVIGLGISDALRDARALSLAILDSGPGAIERWWRRRDVERVEMFHWSRDLGRAEPVDALQRLTAIGLATAPDVRSRFADVIDGRLRPYDFVPRSRAARWIASSVLRGDIRPVAPLLPALRSRAHASRERRRRVKLLKPAEERHANHAWARSRLRHGAAVG